MNKTVKTLVEIFYDSTRPTRFVMLWAYLFAGVGLCMRAQDSSGDVALMFSIAPLWLWLGLCAFVIVTRALGLFSSIPVTYVTLRITPILGIILWAALFVSGALSSPRGMALLYVLCAVTEVWILARVFALRHP